MSAFMDQLQKLLDQTQKAMALEIAYRVRSPEGSVRLPAAVILLLGLTEENLEEPAILLTRRSESVPTHKGQYAFPGGVMDPEDAHGAGLVTTALRELEEEMGIPRELVIPVGELPQIWTPSGFQITPFVGVLLKPFEKVEIIPSRREIDHHFWAKLKDLGLPGVHFVEMRRHGGIDFPVEVYQLGEHRIWGATGAMLKNFLDRLEKLR